MGVGTLTAVSFSVAPPLARVFALASTHGGIAPLCYWGRMRPDRFARCVPSYALLRCASAGIGGFLLVSVRAVLYTQGIGLFLLQG